MSELTLRILTALGLFLIAWVWYFQLNPPWFEAGLALLGIVASSELVLLMRLPYRGLFILSAVIFWLAPDSDKRVMGVVLLLFFWLLLFVLANRKTLHSFGDFAAAAWMMGWLVLFVHVIAITHPDKAGRGLVIGMVLGVWMADIAAYFVGRRWGRHKLCPAISPGKSVEGLLAALFFGVPVAMSYWLLNGLMPVVAAAMLGLLGVFAGILGDLSESLLKRMVGAKDSSHLLPGHGGILDRLDAVVMAVPVVWAGWSLL